MNLWKVLLVIQFFIFSIQASSSESNSREIEIILLEHYNQQKEDPKYLLESIQEIAEYYSRYPEVVDLIHSIANEPWELRHAPHTFKTIVKGTRLQIDSTKVYFDPRSGAKLKFYTMCVSKKSFCIASPADALLHELLHVQTIVKDTKEFITQGGMSSVMYPTGHERIIIEKENILYKEMIKWDNKPRPIRNEHTGRHVKVSCVTCVN